MHAAHRAGIVHRDLKPANILLASGRSKEVGPLADAYALGAILYELLTGRPPFRAATAMDTLLQVVSEEPVPPRRLQPKTPRDLETICLQCLQKEPRKRYASAAELAEDLSRFLNNEPIRARPAGRVERLWRWCQRNPAVASLLAAVAFALLGGTIVSTYFGVVANRRAGEAEEAATLAGQQKVRADTKADEAEHNARQARWRAYILAMQQAGHEWEAGRADRLRELLDSQRPEHTGDEDLRGFEWHYWDRVSRAEVMTLAAETEDGVHGLAFSPDGRRLATVSPNTTDREGLHPFKVWDTRTGKELFSTTGESCVAYSPDGKWIASRAAGQLARIALWDAATGREIRILTGHPFNGLYGLAFSPDGRLLASGAGGGTPMLWDPGTGKLIHTLRSHKSRTRCLAFRPDGKELATASDDRTVRLWDVATGRCNRTLQAQAKGEALCVAYRQGGKELATSGEDGVIRVWEPETGKQLVELRGHRGPVNSVAFRPNSRQLASAGQDRTVRLWDLAGEEMHSYRGHTAAVTQVAFSPDGRWLASASEDRTVKLWDPQSVPGAVELRGYVGFITSVSFSPNGKRLAAGFGDNGNHRVRIFDAENGLLLRTLAGHDALVYRVSFGPDGRRLASVSAEGTVKVWDVESGREVWAKRGDTKLITDVRFSPDGRRLATASDKSVRVWEADSGKERLVLKHEDGAVCVAFSPDGKLLATASGDMRGWVAITLIHKPSRVHVWDAETGAEIRSFAGHGVRIWSLDISPDGQWVSGGCDDGTAKIWALADGKERLALRAHSAAAYTALFSPCSRFLATGAGYDEHLARGETTLWDLASAQPLLTVDGRACSFSPDGKRLALLRDSSAYILDGTPYTEESRLRLQAAGLFHFVRSRWLLKDDVLNVLRRDQLAPEPVRRAALEMAESYRESADVLHSVSRDYIPLIDPSANGRRLALRTAERALQLEPDNAEYRTTLGIFQYRAEMFPEAANTLAPVAREPASPTVLAYLAMAQFRAGQRDHTITLAQLQQLMRRPEMLKDAENRKVYNEARQVILGTATHALELDSWHVVGPFDNGVSDAGLDQVFPPEQTVDLKASYHGKGGQVQWREVKTADKGYTDLLLGDSPQVVSYAYRAVESPADQEALVLLGTDDCAKLWVNGELVYTSRVHHPAVPDQDVVRVRLRKGRNRLLLKVTNTDGDYGFFLRLQSPEPLEGGE
jgi:WD40 repeat protein